MIAPAASAASAVERLSDSLAGTDAGWLLAALSLHLCGQLSRGIAWRGVLGAAWPSVTRRRACAWYMCGAGLTGILTGRGGDAVRISLAKRELPGATWPALAGTLVAEGSFEAVFGLALTLVALWFGVGELTAPSPVVIGALGAALALAAVLAIRSLTVRRWAGEVGRGAAVLSQPRRLLRQVLPWQIGGRLLRLAAVGCFLLAFGLPAAPAVIIAAAVVRGSGNLLPLPGVGAATAGAALLLVLPLAAGHPVDNGAVVALAIAQPALLTIAGATVSLAVLSVLLGAGSPRALLRAMRSLVPKPAGATP